MKMLFSPNSIILVLALSFFSLPANAQFLKKLGKRAQKAAERTVERRVDQEASKKTDQALDSILEPGQKGQKTPPNTDAPPSTENEGGNMGGTQPNSNGNNTASTGSKSIEVYSKFDFVPGDKQLFFDDFGNDFIGDFPSKWDTNATGEIVNIGDSTEKWLEMVPGYSTYYIPGVESLPEEFTVEFDFMVLGVDNKTSSTAGMLISLSDDPKFKSGNHYANAWIPIGQFGAFNIRVRNHSPKTGTEINSAIKADIRKAVLNRPHISIAVNKQRYRLWINEKKYVDVPKMIAQDADLNTVKFNVNGLTDGKDRIFITNVKIAEGGVDLRRKLIAEGKISTNGILFDSGSANIKPESMGIIRQIYQVLQQDPNINLKIVGHTDSDGADDTNMKLSKSRAAAVKNALVGVYGIDSGRLTTDGKGELEPVAENSTPEGKAQNRRVEFIKQ